MIQFAAFLLPVLLVANLFAISRSIPHGRGVLDAIVLQGLLLLLVFLAAVVSRTLFHLAAATFWIGTICYVLRHPKDFGRYLVRAQAYLQVTWLYLFVVLFCYGDPKANLGHLIAVSLWPSVDNNISAIIANIFSKFGVDFAHQPILGNVIPLSDRLSPALGLVLPASLWSRNDNIAMLAGITLQGMWVFPVMHLFRRAGPQAVLRMAVMATIPILMFFTFYTWWKIYAGALFLIGLIYAVERRRLHVLAFVMAVMTHASHGFALVALLRRRHVCSRWLFVPATISVVLACAWFFATVHPSGQLLRWHVFGEPDDLRTPLRQLFWAKVWIPEYPWLKIRNLANSVWPNEVVLSFLASRPAHAGLYLRYLQQFSLFFAFAYLLVFVRWRGVRMPVAYLHAVVAIFIATNLIEYGGPMSEAILHHRPTVELLLLCTILVIHMGRTGLWLALAANVLNWIFVWRPLHNVDALALQLHWEYLIPYAACAAAMLAFGQRARTGPDEALARPRHPDEHRATADRQPTQPW